MRITLVLALLVLPAVARAQSLPPVEVTPPPPAQEFTIAVQRGPDRYRVELVAVDATFRCPDEVTVSNPCRLQGVPAGDAYLVVHGAAEMLRDITVPHGRTLVAFYHRGYINTLVGGVMGVVGGALIAICAFDHDLGCTLGATFGGVLTAVGLTALLSDTIAPRQEIGVVGTTEAPPPEITMHRPRENRGVSLAGFGLAPLHGGGAFAGMTLSF